jgi:hypothetical protein
VLDKAGVGVSSRTFTDMRQTVDDKAALGRIQEEADRLRDNRRLRQKAQKAAARRQRDRPTDPADAV